MNLDFNENVEFFSFVTNLGRTIVFARASGVNLEGHIMLSTEDVQHNWLDVREIY